MKQRAIGSWGRQVGCIGLGGMPLSLAGRPDEAQAKQVIAAAVDAGMTLIDTADVYCIDDDDIGHNEQLIAKALDEIGVRDQILVTTKGGLRRPGGNWTTDGRPEHLQQACEASLRHLGVDCIELYQLHAPDSDVPFADSVGALAKLRQQGKIRHVGLSNVSGDEIELARGIVEVVSVQNRFNIWDTAPLLTGVVDYCTEHGIAFLPHSPVGGHHGHVRARQDKHLLSLAQLLGYAPYEVLLAWLLALSPVIIPIPGATRVESVRSSAKAAEIELSEDAMNVLERMAVRDWPSS